MDYVFITGRRKDVLDRAVAEIGRNRVGMPPSSTKRFAVARPIPVEPWERAGADIDHMVRIEREVNGCKRVGSP